MSVTIHCYMVCGVRMIGTLQRVMDPSGSAREAVFDTTMKSSPSCATCEWYSGFTPFVNLVVRVAFDLSLGEASPGRHLRGGLLVSSSMFGEKKRGTNQLAFNTSM